MAFVEMWHGMDPGYFTVERGCDFSYPVHTHACYELIAATDGAMTVTVGEREVPLLPGQLAFVFPGQLHAIHTAHHSRHLLCIFSPDLVGRFSASSRGRVPAQPVLTVPPHILSLFCALADDTDLYTVKGVLYLAFGALLQGGALTEQGGTSPKLSLLNDILSYIQQNCYGECTLQSLSQSVKYDYFYLSKFFRAGTGVTFGEYVTMMRVSHARYLLTTTDDTVLAVSCACGFNALRTFNRVFRRLTGCSPREYRERLSLPDNEKTVQPS